MTTVAAPAITVADIEALAEGILAQERECTPAEAHALLAVEAGSPEQAALFAAARAIRERFHGTTLKACSVVNVKAGNCSENCSYCAQASGVPATTYDKSKWMQDEDIAKATASAAENGAQALGLVAAWHGVKEGSQLDMVCDAIETFSKQHQVRPDVNLGILENQRCADRIAEAGAAVYGHNLETARSFFDKICTTHSYEERLKTIGYIRKAGMGVCSGGIVGMGETREQRVEFMEELRFVAPDMAPINFLNPIEGTKLGEVPPLDPDEALNTLAVFRLMLPQTNLMIAGGKERVLGDRLEEVLDTGINAVMVGNYLTTLGTDPQWWKAAAARHGLAMPQSGPAEHPRKTGCGTSCGCAK